MGWIFQRSGGAGPVKVELTGPAEPGKNQKYKDLSGQAGGENKNKKQFLVGSSQTIPLEKLNKIFYRKLLVFPWEGYKVQICMDMEWKFK